MNFIKRVLCKVSFIKRDFGHSYPLKASFLIELGNVRWLVSEFLRNIPSKFEKDVSTHWASLVRKTGFILYGTSG